MKHKTYERNRRIIFALIVLALVIVVVASQAAPVALAAGEAITRSVTASGGGTSGGGNIVIQDTIGQPVIGMSSNAGTGWSAGYWYSIATSALNKLFLPFVSR